MKKYPSITKEVVYGEKYYFFDKLDGYLKAGGINGKFLKEIEMLLLEKCGDLGGVLSTLF